MCGNSYQVKCFENGYITEVLLNFYYWFQLLCAIVRVDKIINRFLMLRFK